MKTHELTPHEQKRVIIIKCRMIERQISQTEISRLAQKDIRRVNEIINGKGRNPEIEATLTRILGLNPEIWDNDVADCTE